MGRYAGRATPRFSRNRAKLSNYKLPPGAGPTSADAHKVAQQLIKLFGELVPQALRKIFGELSLADLGLESFVKLPFEHRYRGA